MNSFTTPCRWGVLLSLVVVLAGCGDGGSGAAATGPAPLAPATDASVQDCKKVLADANSNVMARRLAVKTLNDLGGIAKPALPELEKIAAGDAEEEIRKMATEAVARVKSDAPPAQPQ